MMEFKSKDGLVFSYCFTVGEVININSWMQNGDRHHGIWIRDDDGREWYRTGLPLQMNMTKGQRIAFAWCAAPGEDDETLVAVQNCSTGTRRVLSHAIAVSVAVHHFGLRTFCLLATLTAALQVADWFLAFPDWMPHISLGAMACVVLGGSALGFLASCFKDSDPGRMIDQSVSVALDGIQYGYDRTRPSPKVQARRVERCDPGQVEELAR